MIVLKQIFHEVGPKTKSRRKVVHDIKKVEKNWSSLLQELYCRCWTLGSWLILATMAAFIPEARNISAARDFKFHNKADNYKKF